MKKVIITGCFGVIGTALYHKIKDKYPQCLVVAVDNFSSSTFRNIPDFDGLFFNQDVDAFDWQDTRNCGDVDFIFHLAGETNPLASPAAALKNIEDFYTILQRSIKGRIIYASSAAVYGAWKFPTPDIDPLTHYAFSKLQMETLAKHDSFVVGAIGARFFNVYSTHHKEIGKNTARSMIHQIIEKAIVGEKVPLFRYGEQQRDWVSDDFVADALIWLAENPNEKRKIYDIGTGIATSFNEIIEMLEAIIFPNDNKFNPLKIHVDYIVNKNPDTYQNFTCADLSHLRDIGFNKTESLQENLKKIVSLYP